MPSPITYGTDAAPTAPVIRERGIEDGLLARLRDLKYTERPDIRDRVRLEANFREKFEALNRVHLTDAEFARLLAEIVTDNVFTASKTLRSITSFNRDNGTPLNYTLVNLQDWCKNTFEVVNQLRINTDHSHHRYDVILLINGVPCVQIELKTLGISPRRAMEQIVEYKHDPGNGYTKTLLCFMQLFIVSNRDRTYYFANNNARHFAFNAEERFLPIYEFADEANQKITHLDEFAGSFLKKCDLGRTISRYMVLIESEQKLMIMRPYQVYAVQHIVKCIEEDNGNGFIWHTTGSGKTLTSFKASTLLKDNPDIEKCLFVVDRKDLDRQTREEFNRFQEGCVEENTNTAALVRRLLSEDYADKVIVTTIQKLGLALDETSKRNQQRKKNDQPTYKEMLAPLSDQRIVFIFDECHRSQFGENHQAIKEFFPRAQLFGFTGTPIFETNASLQKIEDTQASMRTTADLFQKQLHAYTITHAIEDGNVLRFHIDYFKPEGKRFPKPGEPMEKKKIIEAVLTKHDAATGQRRFNALLATGSINEAIEYFELFAAMQQHKAEDDPEYKPLNIACVFSPPAQLAENAESKKDIEQLSEDLLQEREDNQVEPEKKKEALKGILADYNIPEFEKQMRRKTHYVVKPDHLWNSIANLARTQNADLLNMLQAGFKYIETESFQSTFQGLFSEIDLSSPKLGKTYPDRNAKLCTIIQKIAEGLAEFSMDIDALGDAYEYLIGQFAAGSGKKAGEFYTPQQISDILSAIVTLDSQEPKTGTKKRLESVMDFACGSGSLLLNVRKKVNNAGGTIGKIFGQEKNITTYNLARMNMLLHGVKDTEFEIFHGDTLLNEWDMMREPNPAKKPSFDAVVANPPFSYRWEPTDALAEDVRFKSHGLAPKSAADFAFLLHGFHFLKERCDGDHPASRRALPGRRRGTHPHQAAQGRPHRHRHRPAREPLLLHRHPRLHPRAQEVQEARRRAVHQRRRELHERQTPESTDGRAHRQDHRHLSEPHGRAPLLPPGGDEGDHKERLQPKHLPLHQHRHFR